MAFSNPIRRNRQPSSGTNLELSQLQKEQVNRIFKRKIQGTYDGSYYGYDLKYYLADDPRTWGNTSTFTYSTGVSELQYNDEDFIPTGTTVVNYIPMLHSQDVFMATDDTVPVQYTAQDTAYSQNYIIEPDMTATLHQLQIHAAFGLRITNYAAGAPNITKVVVTATSYLSNTKPLSPQVIGEFYPATSFTPLGANGTQIFVVRGVLDPFIATRSTGVILLNISLVAVMPGGNTSFAGILPRFSYEKANILKTWYKSQMTAHVHPLPEHIDDVLKNTDVIITDMSAPGGDND